jgi:hypothetical protein
VYKLDMKTQVNNHTAARISKYEWLNVEAEVRTHVADKMALGRVFSCHVFGDGHRSRQRPSPTQKVFHKRNNINNKYEWKAKQLLLLTVKWRHCCKGTWKKKECKAG